MNVLRKAVILSSVSLLLSCGLAMAQDHHEGPPGGPGGPGGDHFVQHNEWHKGARINQNDWNRGQQIDYRSHHLSAPPRGYQWRQVDGNYVLAAVATGVIASAIVASTVR